MKMFCQGFLILSFSLASSMAQIHASSTGTLFNFVPGLGACGYSNSSDQIVASVSSAVFSAYPGATVNPNKNPICQHKILVMSGKKNVTAPIVDYFVSKNDTNVGLSEAGFMKFADESDGVVPNVAWSIV